MILAVVLFAVWKKRRYIGIAAALVAAVAIVVIALDLSRAFPVRISSYDTDPGLSTWKMIWRHAGMALVPVFMIPAWLLERADLKKENSSAPFPRSRPTIFRARRYSPTREGFLRRRRAAG